MNLRTTVPILALLLAIPQLRAQTSAPIPAQIASAKTVFLANAGSTPVSNQAALIAYNAFYQALASGNRYQLTSDPESADLALEVSIHSVFEGGLNQTQYVQVIIRDPKSQSLLWSTAEGIQFAARVKTQEKNLADAATKLAADLAALATTTAATPQPAPAPTKTRLTDEGKK
jgi:hypothetical protein